MPRTWQQFPVSAAGARVGWLPLGLRGVLAARVKRWSAGAPASSARRRNTLGHAFARRQGLAVLGVRAPRLGTMRGSRALDARLRRPGRTWLRAAALRSPVEKTSLATAAN